MKAYKIATLALTFVLCASISMAGTKGKKARKLNVNTEITQQEIIDNVNKAFANASEVVVVNANNSLENSIPADTKNSIYQQLSYPEFAQDEMKEDIIMVSFTYNEDGFIEILSTNSSDEELNIYIISKLENIRLKDGSVTIGKAYNAKFHFKLL